MSVGNIVLNRHNWIAEIYIERSEKLNALTVEMLEALYKVILDIDNDKEIRVVILHTSGDRAFCVGADINTWAEYEPLDMWRTWVKRGHRVFDALANLRQPVIASLQGVALGGGLELAMAADLRVAEKQVRFGLPETGIATCPGWSGSQRLSKLINPSLIKEMVFTGHLFDCQRAYQLGLVNEIAEEGDALNCARKLAETISSRAPISVQLSKQMVNSAVGEGSAMIIESMAGGFSSLTNDSQEGVLSFREKREPIYKGE